MVDAPSHRAKPTPPSQDGEDRDNIKKSFHHFLSGTVYVLPASLGFKAMGTLPQPKRTTRIQAEPLLQAWLVNSTPEEIDFMANVMERRVKQARLFLTVVLQHDPRRVSDDWPFPSLTSSELARN